MRACMGCTQWRYNVCIGFFLWFFLRRFFIITTCKSCNCGNLTLPKQKIRTVEELPPQEKLEQKRKKATGKKILEVKGMTLFHGGITKFNKMVTSPSSRLIQ